MSEVSPDNRDLIIHDLVIREMDGTPVDYYESNKDYKATFKVTFEEKEYTGATLEDVYVGKALARDKKWL